VLDLLKQRPADGLAVPLEEGADAAAALAAALTGLGVLGGAELCAELQARPGGSSQPP